MCTSRPPKASYSLSNSRPLLSRSGTLSKTLSSKKVRVSAFEQSPMVMIFTTKISAYSSLKYSMHLAVLHDIQLPEPCLIKWITCCVNDVAESVLLRQNEHRVQEGFHRFNGLDKTRAERDDQRSSWKGGNEKHTVCGLHRGRALAFS